MSDLLRIGTSGVLAHQTLLNTTSNNISNVNTEGYSRQQTLIYTNNIQEGCGEAVTRRCINEYAERELLRDNANVGYYEAKMEGLSTIDKLLSDDATGLSSVITDVFASIQEANTNPTSIATRNEVMGAFNTLTQRVNTISSSIQNEYTTANTKISETVDKVNQLLDGIYKMNVSLITSVGTERQNSASYLQMQDERDRLVTELSDYMDIKTVKQDNGSVYVNMASGQTLVLGDGVAKLSAEPSQLDNAEYSLYLSYSSDKAPTKLRTDVGGSLGGYFEACAELKEVQREIGQTVWALADKLNMQNKSGMTLTNNAGSDLFTVTSENVSGTGSAQMTMSLIQGDGSHLSASDYRIVMTSDTEYTIYEVNGQKETEFAKGTLPTNNNGSVKNPCTVKFQESNTDLDFTDKSANADHNLGFEITLSGAPKAGDEFLLQPTINIGFNLNMNINKPEDLAFASLIRCDQNTDNIGNATISLNGVTSALEDSAFDINQADLSVSLKAGTPNYIEIDDAGNYIVCNKTETVAADGTKTTNIQKLGITLASTKGVDILANMKKLNTDGTVSTEDYYKAGTERDPGFDFSINGTVKKGDNFSIEINTNGYADNSNGIKLQNIEQAEIIKGDTKMSANQKYSSVVSDLGTSLKVSQINLEAAESKQSQSLDLTQSSAGVELNEEASNLVRFQQSYAACAKIITAAQTVFDALLQAV